MSTTPGASAATGAPSAIDAVSRALNWTGRILFKPVNPASWLALAVCAFLAGLADGTPSAFQVVSDDNALFGGDECGAGGSLGRLPLIGWELPTWNELLEGLAVMVATAWVVAAILAVLLALGLLLAWLSARGELMFLDGVVRGEGHVFEPWTRLRRQANALFGARVVLVLSLFAVLMTVVISMAVSVASEQRISIPHVTLSILVLALVVFAAVIVDKLLADFVVPALYLRDRGILDAAGVVWRELLVPHAPQVILYYVLRILIYAIAVAVMMLVTCMTCCIAAIPFVGTVIFLPIHVFFRAYSAFLFDQLGGSYRLFAGGSSLE